MSVKESLDKMKDDPLKLFDVTATSQDHLRGGSDRIEWIGDNFRPTTADENLGYCEDWLSDRLALDKVDWVKGYRGIHWLNKAKHREGNIAFIAVNSIFLLWVGLMCSIGMSLGLGCCIVRRRCLYLFRSGMS
jgi:hypothetical protein